MIDGGRVVAVEHHLGGAIDAFVPAPVADALRVEELVRSGAEVVVDFSLEKQQIFNECWRDLRDAVSGFLTGAA